MQAIPRLGIPYLDCLVLRGREDPIESAPSHARHGPFMAGQCLLDPAQWNVPYSDRAVF